MSDVLLDLGMGRDPRQKGWHMKPEDFFKYPASYPRLSSLIKAVRELKSPTEDDIRQLVKDLVQHVIWITVETVGTSIEIAFGTRDALSRYSYAVTV
jgi:hypothetical protein